MHSLSPRAPADPRPETGASATADRIKVLIADDHPSARMGVCIALEDSGDFAVCAQATTAQEAVDLAVRHEPQVCLLDVAMPGNGIDAASSISAQLPGTQIIMLTMSRDEGDLMRALQAGASGYLLKDTDPIRLPEAVKGVMKGEAAIPRHLVTSLVGELQRRGPRAAAFGPGKGSRLTGREWEVLELMREGRSTREIADQLCVSQVTIRTHIASILKKLRVPDRLSAVRSNVRRAEVAGY